MTPELSRYLEYIRYNAKLDSAEEREVISEIEAHIEDRLQELTASGLSPEEATRACLEQMGPTKLVARRIYEAYSQGSWKQVLLASMPHLLFGLLFVLDWWHYVGWLLLVLLLVFITTIYAWWHGQPAWIFSWLGYSLLPVLAAGLLLVYLPQGWSLLAIPLYLPLALWWLVYITIQTTKRDWLFSSSMLLPIPIIIGWFLVVSPEARFTADSLQLIDYFAPWIGLSFLALALTIATFIRLRQRWLRISLLIVSGSLTLTLIIYYARGGFNMATFLYLILVMWWVFFIPPLLEHLSKKGRLRLWDRGSGGHTREPAAG